MTIRIFPNSAGWNVNGPSCAHRRAPLIVESDPRHHGEQQQHEADEPDRVRVAVEDAIVAHDQEGEHERGKPDQEPECLLVRDVGGEQPVDHGEAEPSEHPRDREQHGIRPGCDPSHDPPRQEVRPPEGEPVDDDVARDTTSQPEPDHPVGRDRRDEGSEQKQQTGLRARSRGGEGAQGVPPPSFWSCTASRWVSRASRTFSAMSSMSFSPAGRSTTGMPSSNPS